MPVAQNLQAGIYRHYKGGLYQFLSLAHDANHEDRTVVVYMPLQLETAHLGPRMAVRTIEDFRAVVHVSETYDNWPTCSGLSSCSVYKDGLRGPDPDFDEEHFARTHKPRFTYLGPMLHPDMLPGVTV